MHQKSSKIASWRPLGTSCGRLGGILGGLGGILGSPKRHLGDYCMLLNGLERFQNALGSFQEAPERETMNLQWFWAVLAVVDRGGAVDVSGTGYGRGFRSGPLNPKIKPYTTATATATGHRPQATGCLPLPQATGCLLFNPHSRRRAERGSGFP